MIISETFLAEAFEAFKIMASVTGKEVPANIWGSSSLYTGACVTSAPYLDAPSKVDQKQLDELNLRTQKHSHITEQSHNDQSNSES